MYLEFQHLTLRCAKSQTLHRQCVLCVCVCVCVCVCCVCCQIEDLSLSNDLLSGNTDIHLNLSEQYTHASTSRVTHMLAVV